MHVLGYAVGMADVVDRAVVRIRLGVDQPAPQPDPLGRDRIGYRDGLTTAEVWERGRGVWKAKLPRVADAELLVLVAGGTVVGVGSIDGVRFTGDRVAITGIPDARHPLLGRPDPVPNQSRNPVAYGTVRTTGAVPAPRPWQAVHADTVAVLTEAARLRRNRLRQTAEGGWEPDPEVTEPADWAEFVTTAITAAAANVGGAETALRGRPGSWEAGYVRQIIHSTAGDDDATLLRWRTEPIRLSFDAEDEFQGFGIYDLYDEETTALRQAVEDAEDAVFEAVATPAETARLLEIRTEVPALEAGDRRRLLALFEESGSIVRAVEARAAAEQHPLMPALIAARRAQDAVEKLWDADLAAYQAAYRDTVRAAIAERGGHVDVELVPYAEPESWEADELADQLHTLARESTPLPMTGHAPDFTDGTPADGLRRAGLTYTHRATAQR